MSKLELYLSKIVKYGLYAILLTPLAFWPKVLYAFLTPKFILFQILIEIVFGAWVLLAVISKEYRPKFSWITAALLSFTAISIISALFGVDLARSIWGIGARMTGLFAELHFLAWFLVIVSVPKSNFDIKKYLNFSFVVALIVAMTAFYQNSNWRLVYGLTIFSNPTFVAPYFLFHFWWGVYQAISLKISEIKIWKLLFYILGSILILIALIMGGVRGAFIGFVASILFFGVALISSKILLNPRRRILSLIVSVLVLFGALTPWIFRDFDFVKKTEVLKRLSLISFSETTAQTRLLVWQSALNGFQDRMFLGVGPENFNYLFNAHYNPRLLMYGGGSFIETWQDKPHNTFIEILTENGIIGSLIYILIWIFAVFSLFKIFKKGEKFLSLSLASAFIAYLGAVFFSFDSFGSWFGLFLFLAVLVVSADGEEIKFLNQFDFSEGIKKIVSFAAVIIVAYLILSNYSIWRANLADANALRMFSSNQKSGIALFEKSLEYKSPYKSEYQFDLLASIGGAIEKGIPIYDLENTINFVLDEADKAIAAHPNNAGSYTDMLRIYNILGTKGRDPGILNQAEVFGVKSLKLSPNRQETLFYLARTALLKNNPKLAVNLAKKAVEIDPIIKTSHWYLGLSYIANNQMNEGAAEIKKALELGYQLQNKREEDFVKSLGL